MQAHQHTPINVLNIVQAVTHPYKYIEYHATLIFVTHKMISLYFMERDCWISTESNTKMSAESKSSSQFISQSYIFLQMQNCFYHPKCKFFLSFCWMNKTLLRIKARLDSEKSDPFSPAAKDGLAQRPHGRDRRRHIPGWVLPLHRRAGPVPPPGLQGALGGEHRGAAAVLQVGAGLVPAGETGGGRQARFAHTICVARNAQK